MIPELELAIDKAVKWSLSIREPNFSWKAFGSTSFGITSTIEITLGLAKVAQKKYPIEVQQSIGFVKEIIRGLPEDWKHAEALRAYLISHLLFLESGQNESSAEYQKVRARLNLYKYSGGGWGQIRNFKPNTFETGLATFIGRKHEENVSEAENVLKSAQNDDGGWGFYSGELSNIIATAMATLALAGTPEGRKGSEWLLANRKSDGGWGLTTETNQGTGLPNSLYMHFNTPWVIVALTEEGLASLNGEFADGLKSLLSLQDPVGGWRFTPGFYWTEGIRLSVWATGFSLYALGTTLEKLRKS